MSTRKIHNVQQDTPDWHALRASVDGTASEAPTMMGIGYDTRESLLAQKATGIKPEIDAGTRRLFDRGHQAEAAYRPIAEEIVGDELFPATVSREVEGLVLLASCDGMPLVIDPLFEHKLWNASLAECIQRTGEPTERHCFQLEQQLLVTGATRVLFVTSDGTKSNAVHCWYTSKPDRRERLIEGWKIFKRDLANWKPSTTVNAPAGASVASLPALLIEVTGELAVGGNLAEWTASADRWLDLKPAVFETDQDFANVDTFTKACVDAEARLDMVTAQAMAQSKPFEDLMITVNAIKAKIREARLDLSKRSAARNLARRVGAVSNAALALSSYVNSIDLDLGARYMPTITGKFAEAIKGKRLITSMQAALDAELANCKLTAELAAKKIRANLASLKVGDVDHTSLFPDLKAVAGKEPDDFTALLQVRAAARQALVDQAAAAAVAKAAQEAHLAAKRQADAEADAAARAAYEAEAPARKLAADQQRQEQLLQEQQRIAATERDRLYAVAKRQAEDQVIEQALKARADLVREQDAAAQAFSAPADNGKRINLTEINKRLAPISISGSGLSDLGFEPIEILNASRLYRASDFPAICQSICAHVLLAAVALKASTV